MATGISEAFGFELEIGIEGFVVGGFDGFSDGVSGIVEDGDVFRFAVVGDLTEERERDGVIWFVAAGLEGDVEVCEIIDEGGVFEGDGLDGDVARHLFGADDDGVDVYPEGLEIGDGIGRGLGGSFAAIGEEDDAGEALALEVLKDGGEGRDDLGAVAFGFEVLQGGDGFVDG